MKTEAGLSNTAGAEERAGSAVGQEPSSQSPQHDDARATRRAQTRQHFLLAGVLFIGGGLGAIPVDVLHDPPFPATVYLLPLLALLSGAVVWALSARLPYRALHVVAVVATLEIALTVAVADPIFATYYTFVAIYAAYAFQSRRAIAAHIAFTSLAAFAPLLYEPDVRQSLLEGLILVPTLILAGGTVAFLRERLAASEERYRDLSERDPLTGVGNYRMLSVRVPRELRRHRRFRRSLALVVIDLDDFKAINDSFGHQRGDAVLQRVGMALAEAVREHDIVVRHGGDEFCVVAPETGPEAAAQLAERLGAAVAALSVDGTSVRASIGCSHYPEDAETIDGLLAFADAELRSAKKRKSMRAVGPPDGVVVPLNEPGSEAIAQE